MNRTLVTALVFGVALGGAYMWSSAQPGTGNTSSFAAVAQDAADADVDMSVVKEMSIGNPDAAVTVVEYASFTCPHCRNFHSSVLKDLKTNYIDTGKINFIYREVYFDRFGLWAGMVARCGGPEKYFGLADLIYSAQAEWTASGDPAAIADNLRTLGKTAGLTDEQLDVCMNDNDKAKAMVAVFQKNSAADDINSTPSFLINGKKYSNMDYADFSAALDEKLGE